MTTVSASIPNPGSSLAHSDEHITFTPGNSSRNSPSPPHSSDSMCDTKTYPRRRSPRILLTSGMAADACRTVPDANITAGSIARR
ncbi:MAG: hypothetical protein Q4Q62_03155 [Thermoplasmata archaeon]|nr:hypothetical protein [Thermoplasmata archaeon]